MICRADFRTGFSFRIGLMYSIIRVLVVGEYQRERKAGPSGNELLLWPSPNWYLTIIHHWPSTCHRSWLCKHRFLLEENRINNSTAWTMDVFKAVETYLTKMVSTPSAVKVLLLDSHTVGINFRIVYTATLMLTIVFAYAPRRQSCPWPPLSRPYFHIRSIWLTG
jgi:hypothetical protein